MQFLNNKDIKIQGYWDGEPIWRKLTPEEKLQRDTKINTDTAAFALLALGSNVITRLKFNQN